MAEEGGDLGNNRTALPPWTSSPASKFSLLSPPRVPVSEAGPRRAGKRRNTKEKKKIKKVAPAARDNNERARATKVSTARHWKRRPLIPFLRLPTSSHLKVIVLSRPIAEEKTRR